MQMDAHLMSDNITNILHVVNESENNDHSDSDISSSSSRSETSSPTNDVQNQTESQFLIPCRIRINQIQMTYVAYNGGKTITFDIFLLLVDACTHELRHDQFIGTVFRIVCVCVCVCVYIYICVCVYLACTRVCYMMYTRL